ncbi:hypothetical protein [Pantoea sp. Tr-811]|uniref:hypothetical protein n=1 Tax=Pantoea sp. Tr-811 TaxID=2608361 RepID=UPI0014204772|nr:hypothetical protein [Pantoea sp. Tr-811]
MTNMTIKQFQEWFVNQVAEYHRVSCKLGRQKQSKKHAKALGLDNPAITLPYKRKS